MRDYGIVLTAEQSEKIDELCSKIRARFEADTMTPRQRYEMVWRGETPDRIPVTMCAIGMHPAAFCGIDPPDMYTNPVTALIAYLAHLERFGYDMMSSFRFSAGEIEFGGHIEAADGTIPMLTRGALEEGGVAIDNLKFPNVYKDGTLPWHLWMLELLKEKLGDVMPIFGFTGMPGGTVSTLMSLEKLYLKFKTNKPLVHSIAAIYTRFVTDYARAMVEAGADAVRFVGNDDVLSAKVVKEFEFPYLCSVTRELDLMGAYPYVIAAGNCIHVMEILAQAGVKDFDFVSETPVEEAAEIAKKYDAVLQYGVNAHIILHGTKDEIRAEVKQVIDKTRRTGLKKFALTTEAIDYATPNENLDYFVEAAKEYGQS